MPGKIQEKVGQTNCADCAIGKHRNETDEKAIECKACDEGKSTVNTGSVSCFLCDAGKYGKDAQCLACPEGQVQPDKGQKECTICDTGKSPNTGSTTCVKGNWKTPDDCSSTQYLDDSDSKQTNHACLPCPAGAVCEGPTSWRDLRPKFGWFRIDYAAIINSSTGGKDTNASAARRSLFLPPKATPQCLRDQEDALEPTCAFAKCLFAPSCLGEANPELRRKHWLVAPPDGTSTDSSLTPSARASLLSASPENPVDLAILVYNESCNELQGYREDCWAQYLDDSDSKQTNPACLPCPAGAVCEGPTCW